MMAVGAELVAVSLQRLIGSLLPPSHKHRHACIYMHADRCTHMTQTHIQCTNTYACTHMHRNSHIHVNIYALSEVMPVPQ